MNLDASFLFASLFWGSVGIGYWVYGKKQRELMPMIGGIVMIGVSYLASSWLLLSLICITLMVAVNRLVKCGY